MLNAINNIPRIYKVFFLIFIDSFSIIFAVFLAFLLRFTFKDFIENFNNLAIISLILIPLVICSLYYFDLYKSINRFGGLKIFKSIFISSLLGGIILSNIFYFGSFSIIISNTNEPTYVVRSLPIICILFLNLFFISTRYMIQLTVEFLNIKLSKPNNVIIYGDTIDLIKTTEILEKNFNFNISFFVSSSKNLINSEINNIKIVNLESINKILLKNKINYIIIADLPSNNDIRNNVLEKLTATGVFIKHFNYNKLDNLKSYENVFYDIDINILLSREKTAINLEGIKNLLSNKNILVTGGGGSIGSELCEQLSKFKLNKLHIIENSEFNLFKIKNKLINKKLKSVKIICHLIDASNIELMNNFFENNNIDIIYHAAAYKHVSFGGDNFFNFFKNNLYSTKILLDNFIKYKMSNFILVSTDKATEAVNVMGLTKYLSEILCNEYYSKNLQTNISKVRFGNVLNTSGSVIPIFKQQILDGGPITLTHKDVTRYFMTKDEAVELILQSSYMNKKNDLFFLDMGHPIKIYKLAKTMINLMGKKLYNNGNLKKQNEIKIIIKGLEKGEKLHEKIHTGNLEKTSHQRIYLSKEKIDTNGRENEFMLIAKCIELIENYKIDELKNLIKLKYKNIEDIEI